MDDRIAQNLAKASEELAKIADNLKNNDGGFSSGKEESSDFWSDLSGIFYNEGQNIITEAFDQIMGNKPEGLDPDQLYGWYDSFQQSMGNKVSAPNSEIRKLQDMLSEMERLLKK